MPKAFFESKELILDEDDQLVELERAPGNNTCGMVGWVFTMRTPAYPNGRRLVAIANDITYKVGSFGPQEDQFSYLASQYARERGLPRIYLSANSGARIGLAEEVMNLFSLFMRMECSWQAGKGIQVSLLDTRELREATGQV